MHISQQKQLAIECLPEQLNTSGVHKAASLQIISCLVMTALEFSSRVALGLIAVPISQSYLTVELYIVSLECRVDRSRSGGATHSTTETHGYHLLVD